MKSKYLMIGADVCAALFLFSGIMLCRQYADGKQATEAFEQVAALVETKPLPELTAFEKYRAVQEQNSDFVGWLSVPGTNIDYPVMQTVDEPNFYLKRGFKYYHFTCAESAEDFGDYIVQCKALSLYDTGVTAEYGDKLITLSTCEYSRKNGRIVVVAKRIAVPSTEVDSDA